MIGQPTPFEEDLSELLPNDSRAVDAEPGGGRDGFNHVADLAELDAGFADPDGLVEASPGHLNQLEVFGCDFVSHRVWERSET